MNCRVHLRGFVTVDRDRGRQLDEAAVNTIVICYTSELEALYKFDESEIRDNANTPK